ncbi:MAG: 6-pyruvoyl-tetrahydropterin synthase-related protein [Patescibacteria group bacterium]
MKKLITRKNLFITILAVLIFSYLAIPLLKSGLPINHDFEIYLTWYTEFEQNIKDGNLIPRWSPNTWYGLGSPLFNFISPGFYYLIGFFRLFSLSILNSVKLAIWLCSALGFSFMFLFTKKLWGKWPALLCATIYTFFPYRMGLVFARGDYAELLAMTLFPINLLLFHNLITKRKPIYLLLSILTIFLQMIAHNILSVMFIAVIFLFILFFTKKPYRNLWKPISALLLGILMASWFWLPAFVEKSQINLDELTEGITMSVGQYDFHNHFVQFKEMVSVQSEYYLDHAPKFLSYLGLIIIPFGLIVFLKNLRRRDQKWRYLSFWLLILLISLFMTTSLATFVWESIPALALFQYPSRFLSLVGLSIAGLAGIIVFIFKNNKLKIACIVLAVLYILTAVKYSWPIEYLGPKEDHLYSPPQIILSQMKSALTQEDWFSSLDKVNVYSMEPAIIYRNVSVQHVLYLRTETIVDTAKLIQAGEDVQPPMFQKLEHPDTLEVIESTFKSTEYNIKVTASQPSNLIINTFYFPGWKVWIDGNLQKNIDLVPFIRTMKIAVPAGNHTVLVKYTDTKTRLVAKTISLLALLTTIILYIFYRRPKKQLSKIKIN